jgi:hypothetical protein
MVVVLYQPGCKGHADKAAADIKRAFKGHVQTSLHPLESPGSWPTDDSWDDLLIIFFRHKTLPKLGARFIQEYLNRPHGAALLPVSVSEQCPVPPGSVSRFKALQYDAKAQGRNGSLAKRVGAMLGLRLHGRDGKIFLSHRASDGKRIAAQLEAHLRKLGYHPFLDEARDGDGYTAILPGSEAQKEIDSALAEASLVLLLDTPDAPGSTWIKHEVDTADGMLVPILPIHFKLSGDLRKGPRFPSLLSLQRWEELPLPPVTRGNPLSKEQLGQIVQAAEQYLCEIFQRKCRVPFLVRKEFESNGFSWKVLDPRLLMYRCSKPGQRLTTNVLNHCSIFEQIYAPALDRFRHFLVGKAWANHSLFIYDGDLLPATILNTMLGRQDDDNPIRVLHHQELPQLIASNFMVLGSA